MLILTMPVTPGAYAAYEPGSITLLPTVGFSIFDKSSRLKNSPTASMKAAYGLSETGLGNLGIEAAFSAGRMKPGSGEPESETFLVRAGPFLALEPIEGITPILSAGFGIFSTRGSINSVTGTNPYLTIGGGASYQLGKNIQVRGDLSRLMSLDTNAIKGVAVTFSLGFSFGTPPPVFAPARPENCSAVPAPAPAAAVPDSSKPQVADPETVQQPELAADTVAPATDEAIEPAQEKRVAIAPLAASPAPLETTNLPAASNGPPAAEASLPLAADAPACLPKHVAPIIISGFSFNKYDLPLGSFQRLRKAGALAGQYPDSIVLLDAVPVRQVPKPKTNQRIGMLRLQSVKDYLVRYEGVDPKRIETRGEDVSGLLPVNSGDPRDESRRRAVVIRFENRRDADCLEGGR